MPTVLTHAAVALALGQSRKKTFRVDAWFWFLAIFCSILPDFDVIGFSFGIRYGDLWGHRGLTHSILFAVAVGILAGIALGGQTAEKIRNCILLFGITASHGVLDAMTNGGLGIAFFSPFDARRCFFPWRPIPVSPIGAGWLFSDLGLRILLTEVFFVWLPVALIGLVLCAWRKWQQEEQQIKDKT